MAKTLTVGAVLTGRLVQLRNRNSWSQADVAERMNAYGWSWVRSTVAKVELSLRAVSIEELISLGAVFGVTPSALLVTEEPTMMRVAPAMERHSYSLWEWLTGTSSMGDADEQFGESLPDYIKAGERRLPGLWQLRGSVARLERIAGYTDPKFTDDDIVQTLDDMRALITEMITNTQRAAARIDPPIPTAVARPPRAPKKA